VKKLRIVVFFKNWFTVSKKTPLTHTRTPGTHPHAFSLAHPPAFSFVLTSADKRRLGQDGCSPARHDFQGLCRSTFRGTLRGHRRQLLRGASNRARGPLPSVCFARVAVDDRPRALPVTVGRHGASTTVSHVGKRGRLGGKRRVRRSTSEQKPRQSFGREGQPPTVLRVGRVASVSHVHGGSCPSSPDGCQGSTHVRCALNLHCRISFSSSNITHRHSRSAFVCVCVYVCVCVCVCVCVPLVLRTHSLCRL
jgi:hypothetical protein